MWKPQCTILFLTLSLSGLLRAQSPEPATAHDYHFTISTAQVWTDTGLDLSPGNVLQVKATPSPSQGCDPSGIEKAETTGGLPVSEAPTGALIAKLQAEGPVVGIGTEKELHASTSGHLFLGANFQGKPPCTGSFAVSVHLSTAGDVSPDTSGLSSTAPTAPTMKQKLTTAAQTWLAGQLGTGSSSQVASAAGSSYTPGTSSTVPATATMLKISETPLDGGLTKGLDALPRRVQDEFNNLGDMVNFAVVGTQQQVQSALEAANWHLADTNNRESAVKAVIQTYQKKDYLEMPMSQLKLFGRFQDFGYEQAEAFSVVASRHHFRLWKAPFTFQGEPVWVGAGTHDIGFEKDQRNGKITHKIDPAVDIERDNVGASLQKAGKAKSMFYYLPSNPVQEAKNATGGSYHSDGRLLLVFLQ